jgi:hypothetical protein
VSANESVVFSLSDVPDVYEDGQLTVLVALKGGEASTKQKLVKTNVVAIMDAKIEAGYSQIG